MTGGAFTINQLDAASSAAATDVYEIQDANGVSYYVTGAQITAMVFSTTVALTGQSTATGATAGVATLPSGPVGFLQVSINGTAVHIPYYAT